MNENAGKAKANKITRREKLAKQKLKKKLRQRERIRRVPLEVSTILSLNTDRIIRILDQFNIDLITLQEAKDWINIPEVAPDHAKIIFQKVEEVKFRNEELRREREAKAALEELNREKRAANRENLEIEARKRIIEKLKGNNKKFSYIENRVLDEDLYYLARDIAGQKPSDIVDAYIDDEYCQLIAKYGGIRFDDHTTYPAHYGDCDMEGKDDSCQDREEKFKSAEREERKLQAGMKEIAIMTGDIQKGDYVLFYFDSKIGLVKRVNKVSYTIEATGNKADLGLMKNYRTNPEYAKKIDINDYPSYEVDDEVMVTCPDGHKRLSKIVEKRDSFYLVEYQIKSKKQNSYSWIDPMRFIKDED